MSTDTSRDVIVDMAGLECAMVEMEDVLAVRSRLVKAGRLSIDIAHQIDRRLGLEHDMAELYLRPCKEGHYNVGLESITSKMVSIATEVFSYLSKLIARLLLVIAAWLGFKWLGRDKKDRHDSAKTADSGTLSKMNEAASKINTNDAAFFRKLVSAAKRIDHLYSREKFEPLATTFVNTLPPGVRHAMRSESLREMVGQLINTKHRELLGYVDKCGDSTMGLKDNIIMMKRAYDDLCRAANSMSRSIPKEDIKAVEDWQQVATGRMTYQAWLQAHPAHDALFESVMGAADKNYRSHIDHLKEMNSTAVFDDLFGDVNTGLMFHNERYGMGRPPATPSAMVEMMSQVADISADITGAAVKYWRDLSSIEPKLDSTLKKVRDMLEDIRDIRPVLPKPLNGGQYDLYTNLYFPVQNVLYKDVRNLTRVIEWLQKRKHELAGFAFVNEHLANGLHSIVTRLDRNDPDAAEFIKQASEYEAMVDAANKQLSALR